MTREPGKWDLYAYGGQPAASPDPRCLTGRVLCVSKTSRTLRWMVDGRTLTTVEVRFGSEYTPTREGVFSVYFKSRDHVSTLYDTPMPYAMFFSGGQAVHYSSDFAARGYYGASHGCVNVRDEAKIAQLFAQVRNGDKVSCTGDDGKWSDARHMRHSGKASGASVGVRGHGDHGGMRRGRDRGNVSRPRRGARAVGTGGTPALCDGR